MKIILKVKNEIAMYTIVQQLNGDLNGLDSKVVLNIFGAHFLFNNHLF